MPNGSRHHGNPPHDHHMHRTAENGMVQNVRKQSAGTSHDLHVSHHTSESLPFQLLSQTSLMGYPQAETMFLLLFQLKSESCWLYNNK